MVNDFGLTNAANSYWKLLSSTTRKNCHLMLSISLTEAPLQRLLKQSKRREEMCEFFKRRGFPDSAGCHHRTGKHRAHKIDRETALKTSQGEEINIVPFSFTYYTPNLAVKISSSKTSKFSAMIPKINLYFHYHHLFHSNATKI